MATGSQELDVFVRDALLRGQDKAEISKALLSAGWREEQIRGALGAWADTPFVVPVPRPRASVSAREAFLYLVMFATLYFFAYHLGSLLFDLINRVWPDPAQAGFERFGSSMRWATAAILISFPVFAYVSHYVARDVALHRARHSDRHRPRG